MINILRTPDDFKIYCEGENADAVLNTVSHLCAGIHAVNRVGDDTSGRHWSRTRALGINSLAFRLCRTIRFTPLTQTVWEFLKKISRGI